MSRREAERGKEPRRGWIPVLSLAGLLALWTTGAWIGGDPEVLPTPWQVAPLILGEVVSGELPRHLAATLARVILAFVVAMSIGTAIGLLMGRSRGANRWLDPWLIAFLNLPALVTIVLCYLWIGLNEAAAVLAVALNKIPLVVVTIREGARALDRDLEDMARVFRMTRQARLRHLVLPQLAPFFASAGRSGVSLIWKIVLVVEFLGRGNGIGFQIHLYFQLFDVGMILAYALSFIAVMLAIESFLLQPWETRASRWRRA